MSDSEADSEEAEPPNPVFPFATYSIAALLAAVFALQRIWGGPEEGYVFTLSDEGMLRMGALQHGLVYLCGDWWRRFTAPLLHGGWLHITFNCGWLIFAGRFLERYVGGWTMLSILAIGAATGSAISVLTLSDPRFSVGASGGIVALGAAGAMLGYLGDRADHISEGRKGRLAQLVILALLPTDGGVDYAAHFGGALAGAVIGLVLVFGDAPDGVSPRRRRFGQLMTCAYAAIALFGAVRLAQFPRTNTQAEFDDRFEGALLAAEAGQLEAASGYALQALRMQLTGINLAPPRGTPAVNDLLVGLAGRAGASPGAWCAENPSPTQQRLQTAGLCP